MLTTAKTIRVILASVIKWPVVVQQLERDVVRAEVRINGHVHRYEGPADGLPDWCRDIDGKTHRPSS